MVGAVGNAHEHGFFGERLGAHLGMQSQSLGRVDRRHGLQLAVTRLTCNRTLRDRTAPIPSESAFSILHQMSDLERHSCWLGGRRRYSGSFGAGTVSVIDLRDNPQCEFLGLFDVLQYYVPRAALDDFTTEHDCAPISTLTWMRDRRDSVMSAMSTALLAAIEAGHSSNALFLDYMTLALLSHFAGTYGRLCPTLTRGSGTLAPWQRRRAEEMMRARLDGHISIEEIAAECRLTRAHFTRAFRQTTGAPPHRYLTHLRIEEAKRLLLGTSQPVATIALACGFADQGYFTRVFSRYVGISPATWRREFRR